MSQRTARKIDNHGDAVELARRRVPKIVFHRLEGGTFAGQTQRETVDAFEHVRLVPRVGTHFERRDLGTTVLGHRISMPVLTAPAGGIRLSHPDGELGVTRAVGAAGTIQIVPAMTSFPIEAIADAAAGPIFFQLSYPGSLEAVEPVLERLKAAKVAAIVLTIDMPAGYRRERLYRERDALHGGNKAAGWGGPTLRNFHRIAPDVLRHPRWLYRYARDYRDAVRTPMLCRPDGSPMYVWEAPGALFSRPVVWADIPWLHDHWQGSIVVKGILSVEDARRAVDAGASAIVVSNHGGNMFDGAPPSVTVLPDIVDAVGGQVEVLLDSGVRRGTDVLRAVALGARAVLIGRSYAFAHAAAGEAGVRRVLEVYRTDIDRALALLGCGSIAELDRSYVQQRRTEMLSTTGG
jgi:isopentenyl diphosphate isomerase/L-lactate dehydrogenase-like FMN-dependent dehydrogenase